MGDILSKCFENCTYSAEWSLPSGKKTNECRLYRASFETIPRKGQHMLAFQGNAYSSQELCHKPVVVKTIKCFSGDADDLKFYVLCIETGRAMADEFSKLLGIHGIMIRFVVPVMTTVHERTAVTKVLKHKQFERDEAVVFEERLKGNFQTFVGKRGESLSMDDNSILEAFCHFTYIASKKDFVMCGLKGVRNKMLKLTLTNPTIHSKDGRFGPKDKRDPGIIDVLNNHTCNDFCRIFTTKQHFREYKI